MSFYGRALTVLRTNAWHVDMATFMPNKLSLPRLGSVLAQLKILPAAYQSLAHDCRTFSSHGKDDRLKKLSERRYWANKYQDLDSPFDWFLSEEVVSSFVCHTLLNVASKRNFHEKSKRMFNRVQPVNVLDLGCGKSSLPLYFYEWTPFPVAIHCLDYVHEAVDFQLKNLRAAPAGHPGSYVCGVCASVCHLPYQSDHFHLVTDKGTMDAVLKDPANGSDRARAMLKEVERVLKSGGSFMQVTDEDPDSRMYFLERHSPANCNWGFSILIDHSTNSKECFVYSFCK